MGYTGLQGGETTKLNDLSYAADYKEMKGDLVGSGIT